MIETLPAQSTIIPPDRINEFLQVTYPVLWTAINHHKTHKNKYMTLKKHQYLKGILMDDSDFISVIKSTQCGISEVLVVYAINETIKGRAVFYVLPTFDIMGRFVSNRFEKSLLYTKYYHQYVGGAGEIKIKRSDNKTLKDIGGGVISFAGSNTPVPFTEFPADTLVIDEKDQCNQEHILMGKERLSHSDHKREFTVSNPTITNFGIHEDWKESDQKLWNIPCSSCGKYIQPDFFKHVVEEIEEDDQKFFVIRDKNFDGLSEKDIHPICEHCGKPFDRFADGEWIAKYDNMDISGYQISKLFSGTVSVRELVKSFNKGLVNDFAMQRFYNADLGLPYTSSGSKVTRDMLDACKRNYTIASIIVKYPCVMGIDVGKVLHVRINELLPTGERRAVFIGEVHELKDILELYKQYRVIAAVIDALPETRLSKSFTAAFPGAFRCFFGSERKDMINAHDKIVTVDRTQCLDEIKENLLTQKILLPANAESIPDYYDQMLASTRIWNDKKEKYVWEEGNYADHYFLAEGYCDLAYRILKLIKS